jgi:hypothetical protein
VAGSAEARAPLGRGRARRVPGARPALLLLGAALLAAALAGCVSTQRRNERARLTATRVVEGRRAQQVARPGRAVAVTGVQVVRGGGRTAVVVSLRNRASRPLTDVPVTVGVRTAGGREAVLNGRSGLGWFEKHLPAIAAGGRANWVFTTRRPVPAGRPFARAGTPGGGDVVASEATALPRVRAAVVEAVVEAVAGSAAGGRAVRGGRARAAHVRVAVVNDSDVPQAAVQVYALARDDGRWVAAGRATVRRLDERGRATVAVPLAGATGRGELRVQAIPTIFE